ncbi:methylated-DNA--[protein]-cysteine S-methyltransferase [Candidatus Acetothermia bacterium]|nr:methylated-DNA--[protein]-cysteine S-methyltransferase [Candidatus Acetothermia bacterium]
MIDRLWWTTAASAIGELHVVSSENGLCLLGLAKPIVPTQFRNSSLCHSKLHPTNRAAIKEVTAYLAGELRSFSIEIDLRGTLFQLAVWHAAARIPYGKTTSYSDLAVKINRPAAARAVGRAMGANPLLLVIPCHRVIGKNGSLAGFGGGIKLKQQLLDLEQQVIITSR